MKNDLISREALREDFYELEIHGTMAVKAVLPIIEKRIDNLPAVDAVEVVRCGGCEHYAPANGKDSGKPCGYGQCGLPTGIRGIVCADDFCSFGVRMDGE